MAKFLNVTLTLKILKKSILCKKNLKLKIIISKNVNEQYFYVKKTFKEGFLIQNF